MTKKHSVEYVREFCLRKNIILMQDYYSGNKIRLKLKCAVDGYEWNARFDSLAGMNSGCPKCAKNIALTKKVLTKCLMCGYNSTITLKAILKGSICKICSKTSYIHEYIEKQFLHKNIILLSKYIDALTYNKVKCSICGYEWDTKWNYVQQGCGCHKCAIERNAEKSRHSLEFDFIIG